MDPIHFRYIGSLYNQGDAPQRLVSFLASAEDIKRFGGVPAKTDRFHGGFQRALGKRHKKIRTFFEKGDVSPTSVIVAFRRGALSVSPLGYPPAWATADHLNHQPEFVQLDFVAPDHDPDSADVFALAALVAADLQPRVERSSPDEDSEDAATEDASEDDSSTNPVDSEASEDDDEELDIGHSRLREFYDFVCDEQKMRSWIESEDAKAAEAGVTNPEELPLYRLRSILISLLKPAMIVDGQHRVEGAANAGVAKEIVFTVCALPDAEWVEQVFQFVVLNKLAKPISKDFLTGLLNTSLTNSEIGDIEPRLERIGIRNTDRRLMREVNFNEGSPFFGQIAEAGEVVGANNIGRYSGQGMLRIAKRWHNIAATSKKSKIEFRMFEPAVPGRNQKERQRVWREEGHWARFFFAFWSELRNLYQPEHVWERGEGFSLLLIVTMMTVQDRFLDLKRANDTRFDSPEDLRAHVRAYFGDIPGSFFQGWEATGLQSGNGPQYIRDALDAFKAGASLRDVRQENPLFRKSPTKGT